MLIRTTILTNFDDEEINLVVFWEVYRPCYNSPDTCNQCLSHQIGETFGNHDALFPNSQMDTTEQLSWLWGQ
jgi:hypothetical protein